MSKVDRNGRALRRSRRGSTLVLTVVALVASAVPAQAGLLSDLVDLVDETVDEVDDLLSLEELSEWRYDEAETELDHVADVVGVDRMWRRGHDGDGVGVALIDTGVVDVDGLTEGGNVHDGADLSFEGMVAELRYLDGYGHGTHMAGIIAGSDDDDFSGMAPAADLVSVKAAGADGAVDVSQVIAAIDWVVTNRDRHDVRVINLSYGTPSRQDYRVDPLAKAVENAWRAGIVVVAAGGNDGQAPLNNPAISPFVIAVGAADTRGTVITLDDRIPDFSSRGTRERRVDLVAPGRSLVSLRDPGSVIDAAYPNARVGDDYFKGSGSSQAAAVVSGAVALLLEDRPELTPDQVKRLLVTTASPMPFADPAGRGAGMLNVAAAAATPVGHATQQWDPSSGLGSLEEARGGQHVADDGAELIGERTVHGDWDAEAWVAASESGAAWQGGRWMDHEWLGDCWCASSSHGDAWEGRSWTGRSWTGRSWTGRSWTGRSWTGRSWTGDDWTGRSWTGRSWTGRSWTGRSWTAADGGAT